MMCNSSRGEFYPLGGGADLSEGEYQAGLAECEAIGSLDPDLMGEFAYLVACEELSRELDRRMPATLRAPAGEWRTRDGCVLRIAEMTREHLANAIRLFERAGFADHQKIVELRSELGAR